VRVRPRACVCTCAAPHGASFTPAQDPANCDKLTKIQKQLDATKEILHETIVKAIERGERLDELVQRSDDLSATSKLFFTSAQKANSKCCIVM
jgi:synaptobrevin family protein YKT6